jgi:hypothetical protein
MKEHGSNGQGKGEAITNKQAGTVRCPTSTFATSSTRYQKGESISSMLSQMLCLVEHKRAT